MFNSQPKIQSYHFQNQGQREYQEDFFYVDKENRLFIICDGIGGSKHGEVASKIVVKTIVDQFKSFKQNVTKEVISKFIKNALNKLNQVAAADPDFEGMGTTLALLYILKNKAIIAHIGDSRVYYIRNKKDWLVTKDHSVVRELYDAGILKSENEMFVHPYKNRITKALKANIDFDQIKPDISVLKTVFENQIFIICSDGAIEHHLSQELVDHFTNDNIPFDSLWNSFQLICQENSLDNNTCILVKT